MKAWTSGSVAGTGTFRCTQCDMAVSLDAADELPSCPNCGGSEFLRTSLFTTAQQEMEHGDPEEHAAGFFEACMAGAPLYRGDWAGTLAAVQALRKERGR